MGFIVVVFLILFKICHLLLSSVVYCAQNNLGHCSEILSRLLVNIFQRFGKLASASLATSIMNSCLFQLYNITNIRVKLAAR